MIGYKLNLPPTRSAAKRMTVSKPTIAIGALFSAALFSLITFEVLARVSGPANATPDLANVEFETVELGPGVWALLSSEPFIDNAGFVVGDKSILVIDSHVNAKMAAKLISAVRKVSKKPISFLVNTNYHGDHTFGNASFPKSTMIISHSKAKAAMEDNFKQEVETLGRIFGDPKYFSDVSLRLPDVTFDNGRVEIDLGRRLVELNYFRDAQSAGDIIVYVPESKIAWTGNVIFGSGVIPVLPNTQPSIWVSSVESLLREVDVEAYIPGHGLGGAASLSSRADILDALSYVRLLTKAIDEMVDGGIPDDEIRVQLSIENFPAPEGKAAWKEPLPGIHERNILSILHERMNKPGG